MWPGPPRGYHGPLPGLSPRPVRRVPLRLVAEGRAAAAPAAAGAPTPPAIPAGMVAGMSVRELRAALSARGVPLAGLLEKSDLMRALLLAMTPVPPPPAAAAPAAAAAAGCAQCGTMAGKLMACTRCRAASYCSGRCQKLHYPAHKAGCRAAAAAAVAGSSGV